jgi:hypothetical protein
MNHVLKCDHAPFSELMAGRKSYELRQNDRDYQPDDTLTLRETLYTGKQMVDGMPLHYSGREAQAKVVGILYGPIYGLVAGWVILSIEVNPTEYGVVKND